MTARTYVAFLMAVITFTSLVLVGCGSEPVESEGTVEFNEDVAVMLPPGHPGEVKGSTLIIPSENNPPAIRYANCFAGVPDPGDMGIGSAAGYTKDYIGSVVLPVNVNLGSKVMESYRVRIEIADPAIEIISTSVDGSYSRLSTGDCRDRCNPVCADNPQNYPDQFQPAPGFESTPTVKNEFAGVIVVEATDSDTSTPTTGVVNLCNVPLRFVDDLPPQDGVTVSFTVESLQDGSTELPRNPLSGILVENIRLK